ncbi:substrate-binding domain-containing protein [Rhizobium sp. C4]|uniref:substrate-binding domain-containing protein n=1 Tax=Rhizobium sp. C4 TaxID=1349800 RepID=UPI001E586CA1|nr:substrate-binding domain-containing protein [Rhizobium sp. C4]MCD2175131.1 substrate-binding domain-containing protein [Rhizobium sp. C4]
MKTVVKNMTRRTAMMTIAAACLLSSVSISAAADKIVMAVIPKLIGIPYFTSTGVGAQEAAKELGVEVDYNGPTDASVEGQVNIINQAIRRKVNVIAIAGLDANALAPSLKRAQQAGIKVVTWDSDVDPSARTVFVEAVSFEGMAKSLIDSIVKDGVTEGPLVVLTGSATAANQLGYIKAIKAYLASSYPKMSVAAVLAGDEDAVKSKNLVSSYFQGNPDTKGIVVIGATMTAALEALKDKGLIGKVAVAGHGLPSVNGGQLKDGTLSRFILWNPVDLGYAAVYVAYAVATGKFDAASGVVPAGRIGEMKVKGDTATLADPFVFTKENVDKFNF